MTRSNDIRLGRKEVGGGGGGGGGGGHSVLTLALFPGSSPLFLQLMMCAIFALSLLLRMATAVKDQG